MSNGACPLLNMTHWSSNPHQPKTTTISRRLRDRAKQHLSVQPPEIPQIRGPYSCRAATLPTPRHNPIDYQTPGSHPPSLAWNTSHILDDTSHNRSSQPTSPAQDRFLDSASAQTAHFSLHESHPGSDSTVVPTASNQIVQTDHILPTQSQQNPTSPSLSTSIGQSLQLQSLADFEQPHEPILESQDMSTLGFMMPSSQYGMGHYGSSQTSYAPGYPPPQPYGEPRASAPGPYGPPYSSSPTPNESQQRRNEQHAVQPPYPPQHPSLPRSPYEQHSSDHMRANTASLGNTTHAYTYSTSHSTIPNQPLGGSAYPPPQLYPPSSYAVSDYHPLPTMYPPNNTTPATYAAYDSPSSAPVSSASVPALSSSPSTQGNPVMPRVINSRPKPQCWEHGCNGRQFSTFSNLLRHQREKSGTASKSTCPRCGAEFTRTTARNGHMAHDKCKPRRPSEATG
ncbi:hypothetical protein PSV08DRAFT_386718 [Bipolaris maydis]|nr:hypothetical protein J3E73DRAFT_395925 [Bipolaris maydis]KAJ6273950.1 hypothetical protein PSV08DRAFT_386718 [Bipolaris maydis]KAJ6285173.1 hypothetical protein J3E71DRAFT_376593 [Bipolaris maydis]